MADISDCFEQKVSLVMDNGDNTQYMLQEHKSYLVLPSPLVQEIEKDFREGIISKKELDELSKRLYSKTFYQKFDYSIQEEIKPFWKSMSSIAVYAALEIDNSIINKDYGGEDLGFYYIDKFRKLIGRNLIPDKDMEYVLVDVQYPLLKSIRQNDDKVLEKYDEQQYMLQLRLLYQELSCIDSLSKERKENLRSFLCDVSNNYRSRKEDQPIKKYFAA